MYVHTHDVSVQATAKIENKINILETFSVFTQLNYPQIFVDDVVERFIRDIGSGHTVSHRGR